MTTSRSNDRLIGRIDKILRNLGGEQYGTIWMKSEEVFLWHGCAKELCHGDIVNFVPSTETTEGKREAYDVVLVTDQYRSVEQFLKFCRAVRERIE